MERISYEYFPDPNEATKEQLNELCIHLLAENKRLREYAQKIKGASYRGSNYVLNCIEKTERADEDKVMSEFDHIHTLSFEALKQE